MVMSATAAATAAAVAVTGTAIGVRCRHAVGRNRHGSDSANQLGSLSLLIGGDESVLGALGCLELQGLILSLQAGNLVLSQEVKDGTDTGVLIFHQIAGNAVDGIAQTAQAGSNVILYAVNTALGFTATACKLALDAVKAGEQAGVDCIESITQALLDTADAVLQAIQGKAAGNCSFTAAATKTTTSEAKSSTAKEQSQDQKAPNTVTAPEAIASAAITAPCIHTHGIAHTKIIFSRKKNLLSFLFVCLFLVCFYRHTGPRAPGMFLPRAVFIKTRKTEKR